MEKLIVKSPYIDQIKKEFVSGRLTEDLKLWAEDELYFLECNHKKAKYLLDLKKKLAGQKAKNPHQSTVCYLMGLTDEKPIMPIQKVLGSLPDIDYDSSNRDLIKQYVVKKHGVEKSGLIGTYQSLAVKGSLKDTVRQFGEGKISPDEANDITKALDVVKPKDFAEEDEADKAYLEAAIQNSKKVEQWFSKYPVIKEVLLKMVGTLKSSGIHASGIVISDEPIANICPVTYNKAEGLYVTQPQMADVEYLGLIKFDFLGLTTLEIFKMCFDLIYKRKGIKLSLSKIPLDDEKVYAEIAAGKTSAVFQFEGDGITEAIISIQPNNIWDMTAINALYRPGPMNEIPRYAARKHGTEKFEYASPLLKPILEETYGIIVYQEQIMEIGTAVGGLSGSEGYALIKAISKKDAKKIDSFQEKFSQGAKKNGLTQKQTEDIWRAIMRFAEYGFNKSHAASYAITGYICAWLCHHYPAEFMASVLTKADKSGFEKLYPVWKKHLLTPSIKHSSDKYEIVNDQISMQLTDVASVGDAAIQTILKNGPYDSFLDFLAKNENEKISKKVIKNLIFAGAFDDYRPEGKNIYQYRLELYEQQICFEYGIDPRTSEERQAGVTLASRKKRPSKALLADEEDLESIRAQGKGALVNLEIQLLGFSTFNYYEFYGELGRAKAKNLYGEKTPYLSLKEINEDLDGRTVCVIGCVSAVDFIRVRKEGSKSFGKEMAMIRLTEDEKSVTATVFADQLERDDKAGGLIRKIPTMAPIILKGKVNVYGEERRLSIILEDARILK